MELEQLDLVAALIKLRDKVTELAVRAMTEGPQDCPWQELATILDQAAALCRKEAPADSGSLLNATLRP